MTYNIRDMMILLTNLIEHN